MKTRSLLFLCLIHLLITSCHPGATSQDGTLPILDSLLKAEKRQDAEQIRQLYSENAILAFPDSPPFYTHENIAKLYAYLWQRGNANSAGYRADSTHKSNSHTIIFGIHTFNTEDGLDSLRFKMTVNHGNRPHTIDTLLIGELQLDKNRLRLPLPTGPYGVGLKNYQVHQSSVQGNRKIGYQVWYPTTDTLNQVFAKYRSERVMKAVSHFQAWPDFLVSHFRLIDSNSILNARPVTSRKFPLLIYNHGYGGFSSVYQTIFEELASQGYVVVSPGHEHESALQILSDSSLVAYEPDNPFYAVRQTELNGSRINRLQSIILNSDQPEALRAAYGELVELSPLHAESVELWSRDTKAVLADLMNREVFDEMIDQAHKGVFGHSVGGATAGELCSEPGLFQAGINLDGFQFGNLLNRKLQSPFLFVSSNQEENRFLRYTPFIERATDRAYHLYITGFEHATFTDLALTLHNNREAISIQREVIRQFFDRHLKGEENSFPKGLSHLKTVKVYSH